MTITFGYLVSSFILSKLDCRIVNIIFLILNSLAMMVMGLSFMFPSLTTLSIPSLVFSGLCYGLGVGPVSFVLVKLETNCCDLFYMTASSILYQIAYNDPLLFRCRRYIHKRWKVLELLFPKLAELWLFSYNWRFFLDIDEVTPDYFHLYTYIS